MPLIGSYHTELAAYAAIRTGDATLETGMRLALALFYGQCRVVLSPSPEADESLVESASSPSASPAGPVGWTSRYTTRPTRPGCVSRAR